ncbi:MAG: hypothetical protein KY461_14230, partial [Actinobacteria bacterium]|nr:hypothetical protein [Actinomycetota bacterium]
EDPEVEDPEVEDPEVEALSAFDPEPPAPADHVQHTDLVDAASGPAWDESTWADDEAADAEPIPEPEPGPEPGPEPERAELPVDGGSTADEPLFGAYEEAPAPVAPPPTDPVPPLFEHPPVAAEPAPADLVEPPQAGDAPQAGTDAEGGRTMRVHDGRLDKRPGPIRMTPSEAIALAQDGPQALRRRTHPDTGPAT